MSWSSGSERELTNRESLQIVARALRYLRPVWGRFAVKLLFSIISLVPLLVLPWPLKILIDHVVNGDPIVVGATRFPGYVRPFVEALADASRGEIAISVLGISFLLLGLFGGFGFQRATDDDLPEGLDPASNSEKRANYAFSRSGGLMGWIEYRWHLRLTHRLNHHYRAQAFERIHSLPLTRFDDQSIGDALYRILYDTPGITQLMYSLILTPIIDPLRIALTSWVLYETYPEAAVIALLPLLAIPISVLVTLPFSGALRRRAEQSRTTGANAARTIEESLSNILAVQSLGASQREQRRFASDSWRAFSASRRAWLLILVAGAVGGLAASLLGLYMFYLVTDMLFAGTFTAGDFGVIVGFYTTVGAAARRLAGLWIQGQNEIAALKRVFWIMDQPGEADAKGLPDLPRIRERIEVRDVDYGYPDGTPALRGASFEARIGQVIGLVGPAGAGKTTLAYLIPRFVDPQRGSVRIDGRDVRQANLASLRAQISFVFQETVLLDATIEENIRLAKPTASDIEVRRAAEVAGAHEFIERLPQGYRTPIGREGGQLSVGQRQRLSIARALVREAPILILDEPTSALDPETERQLVRSLHEASRQSLVIVIAHRLSTIRSADQILFLEGGEIRERGSHPELMARPGGAYRRFVELQTRGAA
jgi:ABC-type multidrug transport system fused ATPase/permease subunit